MCLIKTWPLWFCFCRVLLKLTCCVIAAPLSRPPPGQRLGPGALLRAAGGGGEEEEGQEDEEGPEEGSQVKTLVSSRGAKSKPSVFYIILLYLQYF